VISLSGKQKKESNGKNRGVAFLVMAIAFSIVALGSLAFMNVPVAGGLLVASLFFMLLSLFYSTKAYRQRIIPP
jgi:xanthine/uracil permease